MDKTQEVRSFSSVPKDQQLDYLRFLVAETQLLRPFPEDYPFVADEHKLVVRATAARAEITREYFDIIEFLIGKVDEKTLQPTTDFLAAIDKSKFKDACDLLHQQLSRLDSAAIPTKAEVYTACGRSARNLHDAIKTVTAAAGYPDPFKT